MDGEQLCRDISKKISESDFVGRLGIVVEFDPGTGFVVLTGSTHSYYQKQMAGEIALAFTRKSSFNLSNRIAVR